MIKELRNEIVHEYTVVELKELFTEVLNESPALFGLIESTLSYSDILLNKLQN